MLKNNKAAGANNIPAELLKYGRNQVINSIHDLVTLVWEKEQMPKDWGKSIIFPIHKKGDKLNWANYKGIALLRTVYKVFTNIIRRRLEPYMERIVGEYQGGFRAGRSTTD
jgi:sorting nexin-29